MIKASIFDPPSPIPSQQETHILLLSYPISLCLRVVPRKFILKNYWPLYIKESKYHNYCKASLFVCLTQNRSLKTTILAYLYKEHYSRTHALTHTHTSIQSSTHTHTHIHIKASIHKCISVSYYTFLFSNLSAYSFTKLYLSLTSAFLIFSPFL